MKSKDWIDFWSSSDKLDRWQIPDDNFLKFSESIDFQDKNVLDVGAGVGRHSIYCARKGSTVTGFDSSEQAITTFKEIVKKEGLNVSVSLSGFDYLDNFENESFDMVIAWNVLYHYTQDDMNALIDKLKSKLKKDGLMLTTFNSVNNSHFRKLDNPESHCIKKANKNGTEYDIYYCDEKDISSFLDGFDILQLHENEEKVGWKKFDNKWHWYVMARKQ